MLSSVVFFLLLGFASKLDNALPRQPRKSFMTHIAGSTIEFLSPSNGQQFSTNQSIPIKWKKIAGASNYSMKWNSSAGSNFETFKTPSKCKPRVWIGPLVEGCWDVFVDARNQTGDAIDSGSISFRVCPSLPCPNGSEIVEEDCPAGEVLSYYTAPGYKVEGTPNFFSFYALNEAECVAACTNNTQPSDPCKSPAPCKSVNFNNQSSECVIYSTLTFPQGTATLTNDSSTNHYEKMCINAAIADLCEGPYFAAPNMTMRFGAAFVTASGVNDCLQQCIQDVNGVGCRSATFYTRDSANNCRFSDQSRTTQLQFYEPASQEGVIYLEPGCVVA